MLTKTGMTLLALTFGSLTLPAHGQDGTGSAQFDAPVEFASLAIGSQTQSREVYIPVPMPRPEIIETIATTQAAQKIRRTAGGIRIVGPRFFASE
ncbi:MAG TPA: hypothetical protein VIN77_14110 [Aurantimonas sp.]